VLAVEMFFLLTRNAILSKNFVDAVPITPSIKELGLTLFSEYLLPFEVASVILLVALIGAVVLAKTEEDDSASKDELASGAAK
jgi:NADH-quinone oxidoreductase subunit J